MTETPGMDPATSTGFVRRSGDPLNQLRDTVARLQAEVDRLRADLAAARRRITAALAEHTLITNIYDDIDDCESCDSPWPCATVAALSAGGGDPAEGDKP